MKIPTRKYFFVASGPAYSCISRFQLMLCSQWALQSKAFKTGSTYLINQRKAKKKFSGQTAGIKPPKDNCEIGLSGEETDENSGIRSRQAISCIFICREQTHHVLVDLCIRKCTSVGKRLLIPLD